MYVNPFWVGVASVIALEVVLFAAAVMLNMKKKRQAK